MIAEITQVTKYKYVFVIRWPDETKRDGVADTLALAIQEVMDVAEEDEMIFLKYSDACANEYHSAFPNKDLGYYDYVRPIMDALLSFRE